MMHLVGGGFQVTKVSNFLDFSGKKGLSTTFKASRTS